MIYRLSAMNEVCISPQEAAKTKLLDKSSCEFPARVSSSSSSSSSSKNLASMMNANRNRNVNCNYHIKCKDSSMDDSGKRIRFAGTNLAPSVDPSTFAVKFKYQRNAPQIDINAIRSILANERDEHGALFELSESHDKEEFLMSDFERMMADDWLVTRFLLRGQKVSERNLESVQQTNLMRSLPPSTSSSSSSLSSSNDDDQIPGQHECNSKSECINAKDRLSANFIDRDKLYDSEPFKTRKAVYSSTMDLIRACSMFRYKYRINASTSNSEFPVDWIKVNGMFPFKPDKGGNPTIYLRVALHRPRSIATADARKQFERYMLYTLEQCDQRLFNEPGKGICCVFDMTNAAFENIDIELTTWMIKSFKNCAPKLLCYVLVYNLPWFFMATFKLICNTLLSNSKRQSVKFANGSEILSYIAYDDLPLYIQSSLKGT